MIFLEKNCDFENCNWSPRIDSLIPKLLLIAIGDGWASLAHVIRYCACHVSVTKCITKRIKLI